MVQYICQSDANLKVLDKIKIITHNGFGGASKKYAPVIAVLPRQRNHISCSYQRWTPGPAEKKTSLPQPVYKLTTHVPFLLPRPVLKHCQRHNRPEG